MSDIKVSFGYGPMMPELEKQANEQGLTLGDKAEFLEKIRYSINMVGFHVATESQIKLIFNKFNKMVTDELKRLI